MPCYSPLQAYYSRSVNPKTGKSKVVFDQREGFGLNSSGFNVPCGQCIGCRLERSRQWAIRCIHEASLHEENCFITLTYSPDKVPKDFSLDVRVFQLFMKRLRKRFGNGIRFFHCGEYGSKYGRPHYHAIIFGLDFPDKVHFKDVNGIPLYRSSILESLWTDGYSSIGSVTFESAAYVARYILKKVTGDDALLHYANIDYDTGEFSSRKPEYTTMSRRPGIGSGWLEKFSSDVYPGDFVVVRGKKMRPPKFYDSQYEFDFPDEFAKLKKRRVRTARSFSSDNTPERLIVKEKCKRLQLTSLVRNLDSEI